MSVRFFDTVRPEAAHVAPSTTRRKRGPAGPGLKERRYHWPAASMNSTPIGQLRVQLITAIAVIMVSIWGAAAYQVVSGRQAALRTAAQHVKNLSSTVAEHFSSYSRGADLLLQRLRVQWTRDPKRFAEAVAAEKGLRKDAFVVQVAVIGADGWLAYTDLR